MGLRNEIDKAIDELEASSAKRPRAQNIDTAMERRGQERKRSASSHVRQREEVVGQTSVCRWWVV
jgi:hypothetical protein